MNKSVELKMTELQELMCDEYCKFPGSCSDQGELDEHCDSCRMVKLWNFVNRKDEGMLDKKEFVEVDNEKCHEANNCMGTRMHGGRCIAEAAAMCSPPSVSKKGMTVNEDFERAVREMELKR